MDRRRVLRAATGAAVPLLAGCTGSDGPGERPTTDPEEGTPTTPRVTDRTFAVTNVECALADAAPAARFTPDPPEPGATTTTVRVTGTIAGDDSCHTARLADLRLGADGDELTVGVESYVPADEEGKACSQCLVAIDYELAVSTTGARPAAVVVVHDGERVGRLSLPG